MNRILVIEDEETIRSNIVDLLEAEDFEAVGAENGHVGLQLARDVLPDLILCDVMMPDLDGFGVLEALRGNPLTAAIPFIFLTARADRTDMRAGMELGADDYLTKPCTSTELVRAISVRLQRRSAIERSHETQLEETQARLEHLVHHDALTKLPNQLSLREQFGDRLRLWQLNPEVSGSKISVPVLCINLDRFDRVNDTLGYSVGDRVLKAVAEYLIASVEASSLVARMNADEFAIILPPTEHRQTAADAAQRIVEQLNQPFAIDGKEVFTTASIGVSFYPQDGQQIDKLIQNARKAMKRSKQQGGNQYELYTIAYNLGSSDRLSLETDLRYALDRDQLELHYQPQVSLEGGHIVGAEALVRWLHPERGYISPGKFIPIAEENGLIEPIGEWVLYHACQEARQWLAQGLELRIAVNLSGRQFNQLDLRHRLVDILIRSGLEAKYLDLELTESTLVQNPEAAVRRLNALKALGVRIAIDDFGTGYSSLNYLQQFPFDILKVDRCFVRHISVDVKKQAIARAIIEMAHQLELKVIAEGVETPEELSFMTELGCNEMQGYLYSPPLPAAPFAELAISGKRL